MQNDQSDLELIFKKRARRRLVGAIALALLMIILLPMLLKDRTKTNSHPEIAIVMPGESLKEVLDGPVVTEVAGVTSNEEVIELPKPEVTVEVSEKKPDMVKPKQVPKSETKTEVEVKPKSDVKSVEKENVVVKEPAKKIEEKVTDNQFYVQIGVFSELANVKKLQVKLDELGYQSVTEKITTATGEKTRLRTTNFVGKNEAVIALKNIKDAGLTGMVVSQK
jgi:DedD protein